MDCGVIGKLGQNLVINIRLVSHSIDIRAKMGKRRKEKTEKKKKATGRHVSSDLRTRDGALDGLLIDYWQWHQRLFYFSLFFSRLFNVAARFRFLFYLEKETRRPGLPLVRLSTLFGNSLDTKGCWPRLSAHFLSDRIEKVPDTK